MVTGFEADSQYIAREQVKATNRLAQAVEELVKLLGDHEVTENLRRQHNIQ